MDDTLYHYCSTQTGFSILNSRTFRLSALSAANDSWEGRVLGKAFSRALQETGLDRGVTEVASIIVEGYPDSTEGFAFCLSEDGDLLSQWRAYAADGSGVSIGFSKGLLVRDFGPVNFGRQHYEMVQVQYGEEGLLQSMRSFAQEIKARFGPAGNFVRLSQDVTKQQLLSILADRDKNAKGKILLRQDSDRQLVEDLLKALAPLHFQVYNAKPKTFIEEREWRLLSYSHRVARPNIEYFSDSVSIRPFISCLIADPAREVIREVILGPKHRTNVDWMRAFLDSVGLGHVLVRRSTHESYR